MYQEYQFKYKSFFSGKKGLLICLELNNIHIRSGVYDYSYLVKRALFGDGCAAVVVSGEDIEDVEGKWAIQGNSSHLVENTLHLAKIFGNEKGIDIEMSNELLKVLRKELGPFVDELLKKHNFSHHSEIDLIATQGGPAFLKAIQSGLAVNTEKLEVSWDTLKNYGNMS